nr:hypothetical protein [Cellulosimicrobium sp. MM]
MTYSLDDAGLRVHVRTTNVGTATAPYGVGFHPWLSADGAEPRRVHAAPGRGDPRHDRRAAPADRHRARHRHFDLREPRLLAGVDLDDAYVDVLRDEDGLSWIRLTAPDGRTAAVWMDGSMDTWQVCTGDHVGDVAFRRTGVAAEPMSCVADAFRRASASSGSSPGRPTR